MNYKIGSMLISTGYNVQLILIYGCAVHLLLLYSTEYWCSELAPGMSMLLLEAFPLLNFES